MTQDVQQAGQRRTNRSAGIWLLFPVLCGLLAAAPLWGPGIVATRGGGDSPFLLQRTMDMVESLRAGVFPVRWMAHAAYDLGYPFFSYYAALPYYLSGGLTALGVNVLSAIQATQTLGFILAAVTAELWTRRLFRGRAARMLAIVAYTFTPFHMVNVYVRGDSLSEFYAFIWFPLILWTLDRLAARPSWSRLVAAACAYGALILTHNVSALIFSPFALCYALALTARASAANAPRPVRRWGALFAPFVLGFLLTAGFWLPAVAETGYGQMGTEFTEGYFHYSQHFRGLTLVQPSPVFDYSVADSTEAGGPFTMGLIQALAALIGSLAVVVFIVRSRGANDAPTQHRRTRHIVALGSLALATFMITPLSKPLWDHLPLLALVQFPWRFLSVQALFAAVAVGSIAEPGFLIPKHRTCKLVAVLVGMVLALATLLRLKPDRLMIAPEDVTWETLRLYEAFTGNIGTTIRYEYLPKDVVPRLYISEALVDGEGALIAEDGQPVSGTLVERTPDSQTWTVHLGVQTPVTFPLNWWPGWQASVVGNGDGDVVSTQVPCYPMVGSGRLTVDLPPGEHTVVLQLGPTRLQHLSGLASLAAVTGVAAASLLSRSSWPSRRKLLRGAAIAAALLLSALLGPVLLQRSPQGNATFFDFELLPFPHRGPVDFGPVKLLDARISAETASPGDELMVALTWDMVPTPPLTVTLRLVSPATPRHGVDIALSQTSEPLDPNTPITLQLPDDLARGLYLVELTLSGPQGTLQPSTPAGHGMGTLYVGTVQVTHGPALSAGESASATFEDLRLLQVETSQPRATELRLKMHWSTPGTPRNWSLSLRLLDLDGRLIVQQDLQPGYGYMPTTLWKANERIVDTIVLPLSEGLAPGDYTLRVITYLEATMESGGEVDIPVHVTTPTLWDIRDACCELTRKGATILCRTDEVALLGLDVSDTIQEGEDLDFTAEWNALRAPTEDVQATWTLATAAGNVVGTLEAPLAVGSRTSEWLRYTWVLSPQRIDLPQRLDEGTLELHLKLDGAGSGTTECGRIASIEVRPRPRVFSAPALAHPQDAAFGDTLALLGYDLQMGPRDASLSLTLWWQAQQTPMQDLKRFVHLYAPETEAIVAQDDAMPRNWTYPTTLWVTGEIVSETVTLDLTETPSGTYRLGLGWYDPVTTTRLSVTAVDPAHVQSDRLTLDTAVTVKR